MKFFVFVLFTLVLSIGIAPIIPFSNADSTIPSSKSNTDAAFTAATFADKYKDMQFTGKRVSVVIKVAGESENFDPSKRAKEIRYLQSYVLKFLSFSNAVNVVSNQQKNEITAQIDAAWIPILKQRSDVVSVTILEDSKTSGRYFITLSPIKQWTQGTLEEEITCYPGLELAFRSTSLVPACLKPSTNEELQKRGWAIVFSEFLELMDEKLEGRLLDYKQLESELEKNELMLLLDFRDIEEYEKGHIKGFGKAYGDEKGQEKILPAIPRDIKIILIDEDGTKSLWAARMMVRSGLDVYYVEQGMQGWKGQLVTGNLLSMITVEDVWNKIQQNQDLYLLDVREPKELVELGQLPGVVNIPLSETFDRKTLSEIPDDEEVVLICRSGNRVVLTSFLLTGEGIDHVILEGGTKAWLTYLDENKIKHNKGIPIG